MCSIKNTLLSFQKITLLRAHLLAPVLPVLPLRTFAPSHLAWAPNSAHSATRWAAGSPPATSPPHHWPATLPHLPPSLFLHSVLRLHCQALPKLFTPITAKPCHHPPLSDTLGDPAVLSLPDLLCSRGCSRLRSCLECIILIRSPMPPVGTHWKCHFMEKGTFWVTLRQKAFVEAPTSGPITAGWGDTSARGWGTVGLKDQNSWLWWESSTYQRGETPLRSRRRCRRWASTSQRRKPTPQSQWPPQLQEPKHKRSNRSSTGQPGRSHGPRRARRWSWRCRWCGGSLWCPRSLCRAQQRARSRMNGSHVQTERKPRRTLSLMSMSLHLYSNRQDMPQLTKAAVTQKKPLPLVLKVDNHQRRLSAERRLHKKRTRESDGSL